MAQVDLNMSNTCMDCIGGTTGTGYTTTESKYVCKTQIGCIG